jgi:hypothetical protein
LTSLAILPVAGTILSVATLARAAGTILKGGGTWSRSLGLLGSTGPRRL